jgi:hypothetical protein
VTIRAEWKFSPKHLARPDEELLRLCPLYDMGVLRRRRKSALGLARVVRGRFDAWRKIVVWGRKRGGASLTRRSVSPSIVLGFVH